MSYMICASKPKTSVEVVRNTAMDALIKIDEFEELGLCDVYVKTDAGLTLTRDQLAALAGQPDTPPAARPISRPS